MAAALFEATGLRVERAAFDVRKSVADIVPDWHLLIQLQLYASIGKNRYDES